MLQALGDGTDLEIQPFVHNGKSAEYDESVSQSTNSLYILMGGIIGERWRYYENKRFEPP